MIYFVADTHFGHENVIKFQNRPFKSAAEMDAFIVGEWNKRVHKGDDVYILGDMFFREPVEKMESILDVLKGRKRLILGNHDYSWINKINTSKYFESVKEYDEIRVGDNWAILSHYPMVTYRKENSWYMIHGHIHSNCHEDFWPLLVERERVLNAGVDVNNFVPVTFSELVSNNASFKRQHPVREENKSGVKEDI